MSTPKIILAIESSCDDTGAAVLYNDKILANVVANQEVHEQYGGVVPELASRAHQKNIVPVVDAALKKAGLSKTDLTAVAYTQGPGLLGSLMVGCSFAKSFAQALSIPAIPVHHMKAHILAHFIKKMGHERAPEFPFLCLTVSGGHTEIVLVKSPSDMEKVGQTIDDAAGEAFDKCAKMLGLPYPGGPLIDKLAKDGKVIHRFAKPQVEGLRFSFSGVKTSVLYYLRDRKLEHSEYISDNLNDLCASIQDTIVDILISKLSKAMKMYDCKAIALAGGVAANSELRARFVQLGEENNIAAFIPPFEFCTDNAAMIGITGYLQHNESSCYSLETSPSASLKFL